MKNRTFSISLLISIILFAGISYYSYTKYSALKGIKANIAQGNEIIANFEKNEIEDSKSALIEAKNTKGKIEQREHIERILPPLPFTTDLYRELEDFFESLNTAKSPMIVSTLNVPAPAFDEELGAGVITIPLNIESTEENFYKFMEWVENSGYIDLESKNKKVARLMSIESINISFPDEFQESTSKEKPTEIIEGPKTLQYNVTLKTYIKKI
ncbi:hypothetical protein A2483_02780 [Candidatus Peregrinibacteria bacterium RIFOXYC2_FULL_33_13]|nr:MAG: hypothetical protein UR27_C0008G0039 [Candidatus Peregrinibacteria bacterium GW2011_GWA2_33_10]KKP39014.1 MAG: hypothetical protein UR30_C0013G0038 [Candidatus Peregrinibacteria bacterium GW2011_GWC2_33_13]OGJ49677.1 MAG: hypothetical protein A2229_01260 [Candidatus Peregrinibacteria bacterium RIFOXYA2_FULL_33_7]OGJ52748.1 MAG: hypothetical protein A2483_02780 [Candidatus Peregrinibacteria bacterium RIFOXYC2_FULL_33_13]